jgi:hypothetical protein
MLCLALFVAKAFFWVLYEGALVNDTIVRAILPVQVIASEYDFQMINRVHRVYLYRLLLLSHPLL